jgi:hypothetical protein
MKKCPHCHAETFGAFQLFALDYFRTDECSKCKQLVRNDGLRQFLVVPTLLLALLVGFGLLSFVPVTFEPFGVILVGLLVAGTITLLAKPVKSEHNVALPPFSPDFQNDKVITVSGWTEPELRQILNDFVAENRSEWPLDKFEVSKDHENSFSLTFPEDIHPSLFASLINYALYPIDIDAADRNIVVVGRTTLNGMFDGIPKKLFGQKAILYVPENDEAYDVVHLQTEAGLNFANSLGEGHWRKTEAARLPLEVKKLSLLGVKE